MCDYYVFDPKTREFRQMSKTEEKDYCFSNQSSDMKIPTETPNYQSCTPTSDKCDVKCVEFADMPGSCPMPTTASSQQSYRGNGLDRKRSLTDNCNSEWINCKKVRNPICIQIPKDICDDKPPPKPEPVPATPSTETTASQRKKKEEESLTLTDKPEGKPEEKKNCRGVDCVSSSVEKIGNPCLNGCRRACLPSCSNPCTTGLKKYIQPPRAQMCKESTNLKIPNCPISCDTVYRKSFDCMDKQTAMKCRAPLARAPSTLKIPACAKFADETTTSMSYQPTRCVEKTKPFYPPSAKLLGKGPIQCMTTQKHDYVNKCQQKTKLADPKDKIKMSKGKIQCDTIHKLSYTTPDYCNFPKTGLYMPKSSFKIPEGPMSCDTTNKMSYTPVCIKPKEDIPWANHSNLQTPTAPLDCDTVTKMSYSAPGYYVDDCNNCCCEPVDFPKPDFTDNCPRAACY